jgi:hypothetical protein
MAQADQSVQNATFPTVRADINDNLAALFSANSGNTAPSVTVAFQDWIDTSGANPLWKKRNAANNAWITLGTFDGNDIAFEGTLPSQSGNADKYLSTDGTVASWESVLSLGSIITAGTSVASTSGTSIDFTGLPSWVKRVTVMFDGVSTSGTSIVCIQLGDSGGIETTGYSGGASNQSPNYIANTVGLNLTGNNGATSSHRGHALLTNISGNTWVLSAGVQLGLTNIAAAGGSKSTSDTLTQVRITTVNGTDTFDAGSINILYEG